MLFRSIPAHSSIRQGEQQSVLLALVIALLVVMGHVLLQGSAQRSLPEQDQLGQAFLLNRSWIVGLIEAAEKAIRRN